MTKRLKIIIGYAIIVLGVHPLLSSSILSETRSMPNFSTHAKSDSTPLAIDFEAIDLENKAFKARSLKGKTVLLDFWAVWCVPCLAAFPTLQKLNDDLSDKNFEVIGIAAYSGTTKDVRKAVEKYKLDYRVLVGDADLVERFGVIGYPTYFLISPDGKIHKKYVGEAKDLYSQVKKEVLLLEQSRKRK